MYRWSEECIFYFQNSHTHHFTTKTKTRPFNLYVHDEIRLTRNIEQLIKITFLDHKSNNKEDKSHYRCGKGIYIEKTNVVKKKTKCSLL